MQGSASISVPHASAPDAERAAFLDALFDGLAGLIEVRSILPDGPVRSAFCETLEAALEAIARDDREGLNVYVGTATRGPKRLPNGKIDGGAANLIACRVLYVDRDDLADEGAREEWAIALETFPFRPSIEIDSGNGAHAYWLLEEPLDFTDAAVRAAWSATQRGLIDVLGTDPVVHDPPRIMRVPGTTNRPPAEKRAHGRVDTPARLLRLEVNR